MREKHFGFNKTVTFSETLFWELQKVVQESTGKLESPSLHSTKLNFPIQPTAYSKDWIQMVSHGVPLFADRVGIQGLASLFGRLSDSFLSLRL